MAASRLVTSLHEFQLRFDAFERNRVHIRKIYCDTQDAWERWQHKVHGSISRARALETSFTAEESPSISESPGGRSVSSCESQVTFEDEMRNVVKLLEEKPTLVFVGQLKSGKSTLANAILQHHILPSDEGPCTARMVKLKPIEPPSPSSGGGPNQAYLQILKADGTKLGEPETLETVVNSKGVQCLLIPQNVVDIGRNVGFGERSRQFKTESGIATDYGAWVEIYYQHPLLQFIQIVDSPGKSENESLDQLVNDEVCNGLVQTLVYVIDACRGLTVKVSGSAIYKLH